MRFELSLAILVLIAIGPSISILGGKEIDIEQAAYHVNYGDICGGVLIHRKWVLTVAHCGIINFIRVGSKHRLKGPKIKIKNHFIHPMYKKDHSFDYDVQLLELFRQLRFGRTVKKIDIDGEFGEPGEVDVAGWGYTMEKGEFKDILQQVTIPIIALAQCNKIQQPWYNNTLTSRMFCAGKKDREACQSAVKIVASHSEATVAHLDYN